MPKFDLQYGKLYWKGKLSVDVLLKQFVCRSRGAAAHEPRLLGAQHLRVRVLGALRAGCPAGACAVHPQASRRTAAGARGAAVGLGLPCGAGRRAAGWGQS